ncbi:MAG: SAM-dependent methyltransferase, partial [Nitrosopumilus sp.]|nr:SAM-dependent methyltransferase [Nitrosopumilus sp.]
MGKIFAVGVGPGSSKYVTEIVKDIVQNCDIIIGYKYTLKTIEHLIEGKEIYEITMNDQEDSYQKILP